MLVAALLCALVAPGWGSDCDDDHPAVMLRHEPQYDGPWWACGMEVVPLQHPARFVYYARFHTGANGDETNETSRSHD